MCKQLFNRIFSKHYTEHFKQMTYTTILVPQIFSLNILFIKLSINTTPIKTVATSQITLFNQELELFDQDLPIC